MALVQTIVQFSVKSPPPTVLFLVFVGVWLFGAAMLIVAPVFGAIGTGLYGILMGVQVLQMHGTDALNLGIALGSFAGAGLALGYLVVRSRRRRAALG